MKAQYRLRELKQESCNGIWPLSKGPYAAFAAVGKTLLESLLHAYVVRTAV